MLCDDEGFLEPGLIPLLFPGTEILVHALLVLVQRSRSEKTLLTILAFEGPSVLLHVSLQRGRAVENLSTVVTGRLAALAPALVDLGVGQQGRLHRKCSGAMRALVWSLLKLIHH